MGIATQAIKFCIIGVGNTLLTLAIIWLMTKQLGCTETFSNFIGYFIGLINSFFLNRKWTFHSRKKIWDSAIKFFLVFAICYGLQLIVLLALNKYHPNNPPLYVQLKTIWQALRIDSQFYIQIISMIVYTSINFLINKYYTFNK